MKIWVLFFFDVDGDGDEDLYVVSGGTGLPPMNTFYADRLYINENGRFRQHLGALPDIRICGSKVAACDFDQDGDLDLFVGARIDLERYPLPAKSYLLRNESDEKGVHFVNITDEMDNSLEEFGLISDALWSDFDQDGWFDLILCGEWMPVTIFKNEEGILKNITPETGLEPYSGWWNSVAGADFDQDGDMDYVVGNLGLNSRFKASLEEPMRVIAKDFDANGKIDPIITYYLDHKDYPIYDRDQLFRQLPNLRKNLPLYQDYARAQIHEILNASDLSNAYVRESAYMASAYLKNDGNGHFEFTALPIEAQLAPIFGILATDYNEDGLPDILLSGNSYASDAETGRYDASFGVLLLGQGDGTFQPLSSVESGYFVKGDSKGTALLTLADGNRLVLTAINSGSLQAHEFNTEAKKEFKLKSDDASATLTFENGRSERREFTYGNSYLSQSTRRLLIPEKVTSITITSFRGAERKISLTENHK
ncbi:MAG: VCBS repeat-containing protein [Saprospiraceae bacterium]|nr:VCBS repeat-containing protein [Saprospiraceae bacterium]